MAILPGSPPVGLFLSPTRTRTAAATPGTRQQLALDASGGQSVTELAAEQQEDQPQVPVYQQLRQAHDALDHAFNPGGDEPDQLSGSRSPSPGCGNSSWVSTLIGHKFPARRHRTARGCL